MAKTGTATQLGTAEGAVMSRALHARHALDPILDDHWAVELLSPESRERVLQAESETSIQVTPGFNAAPIFAGGVGCLRYAEDEVEHCAARGIGQYVILGAGFDTFALRKGDLLSVYEVDHPDVQALKRERIAQAERKPGMIPEFVPVDFETMRLADALRASKFDVELPAIFSWMNTLPYLTREATSSTLRDIAEVAAPGSRLVVNYSPAVPLTAEQRRYLEQLKQVIGSTGEPQRSNWKPEEFEARLQDTGFGVVEHATEADLTNRYFEGRSDGLRPGVPVRVVTAQHD